MKDMFSELFKKVLGAFQKQEETHNSKEVATNRLKLVLMQDRTNLTPYLLERMRGEMIDVLSKYVEMDKEALELNFEAEGESMALMLSIPVVRAKEEDEIQAILKAEEEAKAKAAQEALEESESTEEISEDEEVCECENCDCEACEDGICEDEVCSCESCEDGVCDCVDEIETEEIQDNDESQEETSDALEVCDWEDPQCNDVAIAKKKKKKDK